MSREIKFRAWVTEYADIPENGYMIDMPANKLKFDCEDGFVLAFGGPGFWACECYEDRKPKFEVRQFTGLRDVDGKDIYEGDILEESQLFVVVWDSQWAKFKLQSIGNIQYPEWNRGIKMKIVGNIYENPDLLK